jgi:hypothetical protein
MNVKLLGRAMAQLKDHHSLVNASSSWLLDKSKKVQEKTREYTSNEEYMKLFTLVQDVRTWHRVI